MTARSLGPALLIEGNHLPTVRWALALAVRSKRSNGAAPGPLLTELDHAAAQAVAHTRQPDTAPTADDTPSTVLMCTREVASALGISERSAQRLAATLDAKRISGRWLFDPDTVHEYITQRKAHHG